MATRKLVRRSPALLALAVVMALAASAASASVFVYYPITVTIAYTAPLVKFVPGSNAGQPDLSGNTITVSTGQNATSLTVTIHPTYQKTYYKNVSLIVNDDTTTAYYVYVRVNTINLPSGASLTLYFYDAAGNLVNSVQVTSQGQTVYVGTLNAGGKLRLDIESELNEGVNINGLTGSVSLELIYTPSSGEQPP